MKYSMMSILLTVLLFSGCGQKSERARLVKIGLSHGPNHSFTLALQRFGRNLEEKSGHRFRVKVYYGSQLGGEKELQEMLTIGSVEMSVTGLLNTYEPLFAVFELPYLYTDREQVLRINNGPIMREVSQSLGKNGLHLLGFYENGFRNITNSVRPINTPQDVKGLMIRTPENPAQIETFRALGAIPTPLSFSELYTALLQGVVDGQENPLQNIWYGNLYEAQKYIAMTHHIYNSAYCLISERFWETLSVQDQQLFQDCMQESSRWQLDYMRQLDVELVEKLEEKGMQFTWPDRNEFAIACQPAYEALFARLGPRAREIVARIKASENE